MILDYLKKNILLTDGAMGTYYAELTGDYHTTCELANLQNPDIIREIHRQYLDAGAMLIRTNTFAANRSKLDVSLETLKDIIQKGYAIAEEAAKESNAFVAGSIGPIVAVDIDQNENDILEEYKIIADALLSAGARIILFETFSSINYLKSVSRYIKEKDDSITVMAHFAVMPDGYTREGISINHILDNVQEIESIDIHGFNCGSGPTHLHRMIRKLDFSGDPISVLPNAGYPEIINERTVYVNNPDYFADKMMDIKNLGVKIIGGCCGTTPEHIRVLAQKLAEGNGKETRQEPARTVHKEKHTKLQNTFQEKLSKGEFVFAVELDPPFDTDIAKIMEGARLCSKENIDLITIADSPMSKVRVDSIAIACKIKREVGIDTMPHVCCRDKNVIALRSGLLAAHVEGIRNILAVTGDPVSADTLASVKGVFNLNSYKFMSLISQMNIEVFGEDPLSIGGALNLNLANKDKEVSRMMKKAENGATFFLTQPIYEDETIDYLKTLKDRNVKILGGILPIVSYRNARFLNNELPGVHVPAEYVNRFNPDMTRQEAEETGIQMAVELAKKLKPHVDGIYFMTPFNRVSMIVEIIKRMG
ncbi:homocysteine S-methyltransferase [Dethiosulfatibacter aminovorans DSM 17477]|uniref:Homocysteine S-methyltransferase n=1 Tax=Dethiosulfatibacter aminovorans DSM 17477 TaxID=1121476 RepID=A0A1M6JLR2_9FIRM|nr:bifunctional homocysteine S-methyltransferase/methylenetetrahydrofolate reductase [Dethiosulfatibacter aminovorans]SHJ47631.1 homocysteine S-methyltransferase [Dethiosulfatibacter aminovorans DSM 17477]